MPLSPEMKELADTNFQTRSEELTRVHHIEIDELKFVMLRTGDKFQYYKMFSVWAEEKAKARLETYIDSYRKERVIPNEGDINQICLDIERAVLKLTDTMPSEVTQNLRRDARRLSEAARLELKILGLDMKFEQAATRRQEIVASEPIAPATIDFAFVSNPKLRTIIERDYAELQRLHPETNPKSVLILSGGIIEGLLIDAIVKSEHWDEATTFGKFLKELIHPAKAKGIIAQDSISEWLRQFRNLVHPAKELRDNLLLTTDHAKHARTSVDVVISEVRQWHTMNP